MKEYYFVVYKWIAYGPPGPSWNTANVVIDEHPIDWIVNVHKADNEDRHLLWFTEIDEEIYKRHVDNFG